MRNPFSARHLRPGAIPYFFCSGDNAEQTVSRLQRSAWWGQIIGPHGSGKSTLVQSLIPICEKYGKQVQLITLQFGCAGFDKLIACAAHSTATTLVVIDGFEQLNLYRRWRLKRICRKQKAGLLVTAHQDIGLPLIARTTVSVETAKRIVSALLCPTDELTGYSDDDWLVARLSRHGGDMREVLFELYDLFEQR